MDCFKAALEYLLQKTLENNGLTGEVIVTKIEPEEEKEEKAGQCPAEEGQAMTFTWVLTYIGAAWLATSILRLVDKLEDHR